QDAPPGEQVPEDGADMRGEDHGQHHRRSLRLEHLELDDALAHRIRDLYAPAERGDEVEEGRPDHSDGRREDAGRYDGGDGIRGVVETVDEVEDERQRDQQDHDGEHQACSSTTPSMTLATSSHRSVAVSIRS